MTDPSCIPGGITEETTRAIRVTVQPFFLDEESVPDARHYVWAYHVRIENNGPNTVQLMRRTWQITDAQGVVNLVKGEGVVGKQPILHPGEAFEYASGAPLTTPSGIMAGTYHMVAENGEPFDVAIPAFSLDSPHARVMLH